MFSQFSKTLMRAAVAAGTINLWPQRKALCADTSFYAPPMPSAPDVFRGSMSEYAKKFPDFRAPNVRKVELVGTMVGENIYHSSDPVSDVEMRSFISRILAHRIKELDLLGVRLGDGCAYELSLALKDKTCELEKIALTTSQIDKFELICLLGALETNSSLITFLGRSYNVERRYWSKEEMEAFNKVIENNTTLQLIELPNNKIERIEDAALLINTYKKNLAHKTLPIINGLGIYRGEIIISPATVRSAEFDDILNEAQQANKEADVREKKQLLS